MQGSWYAAGVCEGLAYLQLPQPVSQLLVEGALAPPLPGIRLKGCDLQSPLLSSHPPTPCQAFVQERSYHVLCSIERPKQNGPGSALQCAVFVLSPSQALSGKLWTELSARGLTPIDSWSATVRTYKPALGACKRICKRPYLQRVCLVCIAAAPVLDLCIVQPPLQRLLWVHRPHFPVHGSQGFLHSLHRIQ